MNAKRELKRRIEYMSLRFETLPRGAGWIVAHERNRDFNHIETVSLSQVIELSNEQMRDLIETKQAFARRTCHGA